MGLYDAMNASVTGMNAQSNYLANIGQNIANAKHGRLQAGGHANSRPWSIRRRSARPRPAACQTATRLDCRQQGTLESTTSATDLAVSGNGFFVVSNSVDSTTGLSTGRTTSPAPAPSCRTPAAIWSMPPAII